MIFVDESEICAMKDVIDQLNDIKGLQLDLERYLQQSSTISTNIIDNGSYIEQKRETFKVKTNQFNRLTNANKFGSNGVNKVSSLLNEINHEDTDEFELSQQFVELEMQYLSTSVHYYDKEQGQFVCLPVTECDHEYYCHDYISVTSSNECEKPVIGNDSDSCDHSEEQIDLDYFNQVDFETSDDDIICVAWQESLVQSWFDTFYPFS